MPPRNSRPPAGPDLDRFAARIEAGHNALRERVEELFDGMSNRIARVERDVAQGELGRQHILNEMAEMRRDIGEARDLTIHKDVTQVAQAAKGAAEGAATVAAITAAHPPGAKTWRYWITGLAGVAAFGALADNLPKVVKFISTLWKALEGMAK